MANGAITKYKNKPLQTMKRVVKYKLVIPLKRSTHPPEHVARGVAVGLFWAICPIPLTQMLFSLITWVIAAKWLKWEFSLVNACAWTWVTNVFTTLPVFYVSYVTGLLLMGQLDKAGYSAFKDPVVKIFYSTDLSVWEQCKQLTVFLLSDIGIPLMIGSIIWSTVSAVVGYYLARYFVIKYRTLRAERMSKGLSS